MIYDCFTYFDEVELLNLRLELLYQVVDYFIIVESEWTFSGSKKGLNARDVINKHQLADCIGKKTLIVELKDGPIYSKTYSANWEREEYQRNSILRGLKDLRPEDIVLISDVDEIPDPEAIKFIAYKYFKNSNIMSTEVDCINLHMPTFYYKADNLMCEWNGRPVFWNKPKAMLGSHLGLPDRIRNNTQDYKTILDAGWHFSYMGGSESVVRKIKSFSHQEHNKPELLTRLAEGINPTMDLFGRRYKFTHYDWSLLPSQIFGSKSRLKYFGLVTNDH